jgi:uncharacterized protein
MKVLHYSDKTEPQLLTLYDEADILITTGDLTIFDFGPLRDIQNRKPAFGVYGNHDSGEYLENLGLTNLHQNVYEYAGLLWGGWQGCLRYKNGGGPQFLEEEAEAWADTFPYVDVLLLHAGPKDMLDDPSDDVHIGSEAIKKYVIAKKPRYIFCGHQYSNAELDMGETKIFRTYGARLIDIE